MVTRGKNMNDAATMTATKEYADGSRDIKHPSGMTFHYDPRNGFDSLSGLSSWGARLEKYQFNDSASLKTRIDTLHEYADAPIRSDRTGELMETHKEVYDKVTGETVSVMTREYKILQNTDLFKSFAAVMDNTGLTPVGRIDVGERGFTLGYATFMNPEYTINILEQYPEPMALGIEFRNSFAGQMGVAGNVWGFVAFCRNFSQWGHLMGSFWVPHNSKDIDRVTDILTEYTSQVLKNSPIITKTCSDAADISVKKEDVNDILWGTNLPIGIIDAITIDPVAYNHRIPEQGLNMFNLYNCVTKALTFRESKAYRSTLSYTEGALSLLTEKVDDLIKQGNKRKDAYADFVSKQNAKRQRQKEMVARMVA